MLYKSIDDNIVLTSKKYIYNISTSKGLLRITTANLYKKEANIAKANLNLAILWETFLLKLPEVKHFSKERKGNQPRLRK